MVQHAMKDVASATEKHARVEAYSNRLLALLL
jgi:hypothetical protein